VDAVRPNVTLTNDITAVHGILRVGGLPSFNVAYRAPSGSATAFVYRSPVAAPLTLLTHVVCRAAPRRFAGRSLAFSRWAVAKSLRQRIGDLRCVPTSAQP
jgi:hypothetical protein